MRAGAAPASPRGFWQSGHGASFARRGKFWTACEVAQNCRAALNISSHGVVACAFKGIHLLEPLRHGLGHALCLIRLADQVPETLDLGLSNDSNRSLKALNQRVNASGFQTQVGSAFFRVGFAQCLGEAIELRLVMVRKSRKLLDVFLRVLEERPFARTPA